MVVNAANEQPIENASVFISNTAKFTQTAATGTFNLQEVPVGTYDIIVSCVGYQTLTYTYNASQLPMRINFKLEIKKLSASTITVMPIDPNGWEKWGKTFLEAYLGITENSGYCSIANKDVLQFRYYKKENKLEVIATDMVKIINKKLGYTITEQLELFEINFTQQITSNVGYYYFEPITNKSNYKLQKYVQERENAYYGSITHLMRSLYNNTTTADGFVLRKLTRVENTLKKNYRDSLKQSFAKALKDTSTTNKNIKKYTITTAHSKPINSNLLSQPDYFEVLSTTQYRISDLVQNTPDNSTVKKLTFSERLYIEYTQENQNELYYTSNRIQHRTPYQTSKLQFAQGCNNVLINASGNYYEALCIYVDGYMGWEKMGEMLPLDYKVGD